jgi:hypothetical protein
LRLAHAATLLAGFLLTAVSGFGCDKLKPGGGADGGAAKSGGGVFSFLDTEFEGEITAVVSTKGKQKNVPQQLVFGIKKPKYRIDIAPTAGSPDLAQGGAFLIDPEAKKGYLLTHSRKTAMLVDFEKMKAMPKGQIPGLPSAPRGTPSAVPAQPPTIEKTGKKDTVAGYTCEIWNITSEGKRAEACVAEGITWMDLTDLGFGSPELALAVLASEANRFPLRAIAYDAKGAEETRMEATKIDKKKIDDARFLVPPDYKVIDMAAMMTGGMPGMPGMSGMPNLPKPPTR